MLLGIAFLLMILSRYYRQNTDFSQPGPPNVGFGRKVQELRSHPLHHAGHPAHPFLACKIPKSILVLDDCALALRDKPLSDVPVITGERLDLGVSPVEVDKPDDIEVHQTP